MAGATPAATEGAVPKIELHVHLEGTVRPPRLLEIARRNGMPALPADAYEFTGFAGFVRTWMATTGALRTAADFREIVVDYAGEAASHGCVYVEGIFSPVERVRRGATWDEVFEGFCDGAAEARERHGVEVRLTPDLSRGGTVDEAMETVRWCARFRDRGVVGVGLGGPESVPAEGLVGAFRVARDEGLAAVPHAGETEGPASVRFALDRLGAVRIRHGTRAVDDPALVADLAARGTVLDVCLTSNVRIGVVASLEEHPLPQLVEAGVRCSVSTDDPGILGTDLAREHALATSLGVGSGAIWAAALGGALCDDETRARLALLAGGG
ncbi:MAG: adenosine deaminase [Acidimicrobiales bacterium]